MKKALIKSANIFWLCLAILIILAAVCIQLARLVAPLVEYNQEYITEKIGQRITSVVVAQSIEASWNRLSPTLSIKNLNISPINKGLNDNLGQQPPSISVDSMALELDVLQSIVQRRFVWTEINLSNADIYLQQHKDGNWQLAGFENRQNNNTTTTFIDDPVDIFLLANTLQVNDVSLMLKSYEGKTLDLGITDIAFQNERDFHRMVADIQMDNRSVATAVLEANGDPRSNAKRDVKGHISLVDFPVTKLKDFVANLNVDIRGLDNNQDYLNVNVWLSSQKRHFYTFNGDLDLTLTATEIQGVEIPSSVSTHFGGHFYSVPTNLEVNFQVQDSTFGWPEESFHFDTLDLSLKNAQWSLKTPRIELSNITQLSRLVSVTNPKIMEAIESLDLQGSLLNSELIIPIEDVNSARLTTIAESISVGPYRGGPALTGVNGFVSAGISGGELLLNTDDGFSMWFTTAFDNPMEFDSVLGTVGWRLAPNDNRVSIFTNLVEFKGDIGDATGIVSLEIPWIDNSRPLNMDLFIGIRNSHTEHSKKLMPNSLDSELKSWLDTSVKSGEIDAAGFVYRGRLSPGNNEISTQLWIDLEQGGLAYHDDWPELKNVNGRIEVDSSVVSADITSANVWNTDITSAKLLIERVNEQTLLSVQSTVEGGGDDGFRLLTQTPIRDVVGPVFDEWALSSGFSGNVDLHIPLTTGEDEGYQRVDLQLHEGDLNMADLDLVFESLQGPLLFDSRSGLTSDGIDFTWWGKPVSAIVVSEGYSDNDNVTNNVNGSDNQQSPPANTKILFSGSTQITDIQQWLNSPELLFANGETVFEGELYIPGDKASEKPVSLHIQSQLEGVAIDLPAPFTKSVDVEMPFELTLAIEEKYNLYQLKVSDWINGQILGREGVLEQIDIAINDTAKIAQEGIYIHGSIPGFDLEEWLDVLERYETYQNQVQANSEIDSESSLKVSFGLTLFDGQIKAFEVPKIQLTGAQLQDRWSIEFNSDLASGFFEVPQSEIAEMTFSFNHLYLPENEAEAEASLAEDPLKDIDLSEIPLANVTIHSLKLGDDDYGSWTFELIPEYNRLRVNNIIGSVRDLEISGISDDSSVDDELNGATLIWSADQGQMNTHFVGKIESKKINKALVAFDQPEVLEASDVKFDADLAWPGSPAAIEMTQLEGSIGVDMEHGRFIRAADGGGDAILRLVALFNFDSWARRLKLGVSDLVESGMAFDNIDGVLEFKNGDLLITSPIRVKAPSSSLSYAGTIDLVNEELDTTLVATLPVGGNLTLIAALAGGLPAAAGVYVASKLFKKQVNKVASLSYKINGSWEKPKTEFIRLFDDGAAKKAGKKADKDASNITSQDDPSAYIQGDPLDFSHRLSALPFDFLAEAG